MELNAVYEDQYPSRATVYLWYNYFKSGRTSVIDDDKPGRPCEISGGITEKLKTIVKNKRKITTRELTTRLNVSKGTLYTLLAENGIRKLCSRFVARFLTEEMQNCRFKICMENLNIFQSLRDNFWDNIITMDETPLSLCGPESK